MHMAIEGMGILGRFGRGRAALSRAAQEFLAGSSCDAPDPTVDTTPLKDHLPARSLRRVDHFTRMALLGAYDALDDAGLTPTDLTDTGIVLATGYGPSRLTFDFLDSIIDFGPEMASPLAFSHSVHNIPAATVALKMNVTGPCFTVSQLETSVAAALLTARTWLTEGRVSRVLLGAVDERTELLRENMHRIAAGRPSSGAGRRDQEPGEGAVFLCLHRDPGRARHGRIKAVDLGRSPLRRHADGHPLLFSGAAGSRTRKYLSESLLDFSPVYGPLPTAMGFDLALAGLTLRGELGLEFGATDSVRCLSRDGFGTTGEVTLTIREQH